ncbi:MAG TPA: phosphatase PAP2 family protein [Lacipirellulaceae bacterium]|jgi:membrane-associated phospholipid phosphatase
MISPLKQIVLIIGLVTRFVVAAQGAEPHFIDPPPLDPIALLPPPPAAGSAEAIADLADVLKAQTTRTDTEVARGKAENHLSPAAFQSVLGPEFTAQKLPRVFALLEDAADESKPFTSKAKKEFARPRPKFADARVQPVVDGDDGPAYPSGHATRAMLWARILAEIAPDKKHELLDRGEEIGWDRVLIGVHYPSDVFAGEVLGQNLAQSMLKNADFQARLIRAKEEFQQAAAASPVTASAQ